MKVILAPTPFSGKYGSSGNEGEEVVGQEGISPIPTLPLYETLNYARYEVGFSITLLH